MELINYVDLFIGALLSILLYAIIIKKVIGIKLIKNNKKIYLLIILTSIIITIINNYNKDVFKILFTIPFLTLCMKYIYDLKINESFSCILISTFYTFIGELIAGIILSILPVNYLYALNNIFGSAIGNILVISATFPLIYIKKLNKIVKQVLFKFLSNKIYVIGILAIIAIGAFGYKNGASIQNPISVIMNSLIFIVFMIIIYFFYLEKLKSEQFSNNYNNLLLYLEQYEKELENKEKIVHDYKNELIVINSYINPNNKKLKAYISEIIKEQRLISNSSLNKRIYKLPKGLKGLIYYKLAQLDNLIKVNIEIPKDLRNFSFVPFKQTKDSLKIVGILLDNAIEAAKESKEKTINLEFLEENDTITMVLENSCIPLKDSSKIMNSGFSTKGKNRGYGLAIVDEIVKQIPQFKIKVITENTTFKVEFSIKIK